MSGGALIRSLYGLMHHWWRRSGALAVRGPMGFFPLALALVVARGSLEIGGAVD